MARWAKSLNQKKDYNRVPTIEPNGVSNGASAASADIGFAVLEKKTVASSSVVVHPQPSTLAMVSAPHKTDSVFLTTHSKVRDLKLIYRHDQQARLLKRDIAFFAKMKNEYKLILF